jgi:superfamily II DNA/RNA helicase
MPDSIAKKGSEFGSILSNRPSIVGSRLAKMRNPRQHLRNGSRDDSFLSTISESTFSSDSTSTEAKSRDSKLGICDGGQIEVFSESSSGKGHPQVDVMKDFRSLFQRQTASSAEEMQLLLRQYGFDKPLDMQRRVMPLVMSAFRDEQKGFITVQGATQCGKTSALVLGMLGAVGSEMAGIRAVVLCTSTTDFKKYFDICAHAHPLRLECFEGAQRKVSFAGLPPDPDSATVGVDPLEDLQRLSSALSTGAPAMVCGHPSRVLPLLREAPSWGVDLGGVQVLALDDAEETICMGLMDEVCEVCTILRHFSKHRLRHLILSHNLSTEAKSMIKCLRQSLLQQQNLFGIRAHRTQARAKAVNHYYAVAPRPKWPAILATLHHALSLPSGIIFDDESAEARAQARVALRSQGVTASVWNALQEQGSGARAAARDAAAGAPRGPAFHLMPSDLVVLKVDLPQVRCVLHFEIPRRELSIYGLRLMCLEQDQKKARKGNTGGRSLSVLFVESEEVVRELEKTFHIRMEEVPTEILAA